MVMEMRGSLGLSWYYTKPNQPKFYGKCLIEGVEYEIKGWEKVRTDTGEIWISLMFKEKLSEAAQIEKRRNELAPEPAKKSISVPDYRAARADDEPF